MAVDPARVEEIFNQALVWTDAAARVEYLDEACADDKELRERVAALLVAHEAAGDFLKLPDPEHTSGAVVPVSEGPGSKIGRYKLLQQIGEGGFGVVFMAEQESPVRRLVALKIIKLGMDTRRVVARFEAERQALAMMDHPSVAKVLDGGATETGRPYFVMELVKGTPITEYCDKNNLSIPQRLELFAQVCHAVQHAHQKGLIHRDIKPSNILVATADDRPVAKVIDFGIAKAMAARLTEKTLFTEFRQLVGTPEYMSPEQAEGGLDIDTRSDVYSLGVLLYELLAGSPPFDPHELRSKAFAEMQRIIREVEPPAPSTRLSTMKETLPSVAAHRAVEPRKLATMVRGELDWIVMKALEKDRKRRYESAAALAADVNHYLADEPVAASPPSRSYRLRKLARRHRAALRVAAAFVVFLIAATAISSWLAVRATRATAEALAEKRRADEAAAVADGVSQFFTEEVFGLADPKRFDRAGIKLVEALDIAASKIDARFPNDPKLQAIIRNRFGEIYNGIDQPQKALEQLQKALELRRKVAGEKEPITLKTRSNLGVALWKTTRYVEARQVLDEVLADQTQVLGDGHPETVQTACQLAVVLMELRGWGGMRSTNPNDAKDLEVPRNAYQKALVALGPRHQATLNAESAMAWSMRWRAKGAEALPYAKDAALGLRETRGREDVDAMFATYNYAACLMEVGRAEEAVTELEPLLASRYRILGASHFDTVHTAWRLAWALRIVGREEKSLAVLEEVRGYLQEVSRSLMWQRGYQLLLLADVYRDLKRFDRAAEFVLAACKLTVTVPENPTLRQGYAELLNNLAARLATFPAPELRDAGRAVELATNACEITDYKQVALLNTLMIALAAKGDRETEQSVRKRLTDLIQSNDVQDRGAADALADMARLLLDQHRPAEARPMIEKALAIYERHPEQIQAWRQNGAFDTLRQTLTALGDISTLEDAAIRMLKTWRGGLPADDPWLVVGLTNAAGALRQNGKLPEARKLAEEAVARCEKRLKDVDQWMRDQAFDALKSILMQPADVAAMESLDQKRLQILRSTLPANDPRLVGTLADVSGTLCRRGKPTEALALTEEGMAICQQHAGRVESWMQERLFDSYREALQATDANGLQKYESALVRLLQSWRGVLPADDPGLLVPLRYLGYRLRDGGNAAEARKLLEEAVAICEHHPEVDGTQQSHIFIALREVLTTLHDTASLETHATEILNKQRARRPSNDPGLLLALDNLASVLTATGKLDQARSLAEEAATICKRHSVHPWMQNRAYEVLIEVRSAAGDKAGVESAARDNVSNLRSRLAPDDPWLAPSLVYLARLLQSTGRATEARPLAEQAVAIYTAHSMDRWNSDQAFDTLRDVLRDVGDTAALEATARNMLDHVRAATPGDDFALVTALCRLADIFNGNGKSAAARPLAEEAVAVSRRHPDAADRWLQGSAHNVLKQVLATLEDKKALEALEGQRIKDLIVRRDQAETPAQKADISFTLANVHLNARHFQDAVTEYSKAIEFKADYEEAWRERGRAYMNLGQPEKAVVDQAKAIELNPGDEWAWHHRGWAYKGLKQFEKAIPDYSKAIELKPDIAQLWFDRADCWALMDESEKASLDLIKAIALVEKNLQSRPSDAQAYNNVAWVLATLPDPKLRDPKRAVELAEKGVRLAPADANIRNTLGVARYRAGDLKQAVAELEKSMQLGNGGGSYDFDFLAMAHWQLGDADTARRYFDQAARWIAEHAARNQELERFHREAAGLLGLPATLPATAPSVPATGP